MRRLAALLLAACAGAAGADVPGLLVPPGFRIDLYAERVPGARQLAVAGDGLVFAGSRDEGRVHALVDADGDRRAERVQVVLEGLRLPAGVAFRDGDLYVGELTRILRVRDAARLPAPAARYTPQVVLAGLPDNPWHGARVLAFAPDGRLWFPVSAPCNVCVPEAGFGTLNALDLSTGSREVVARGIRSVVGIDFHPRTGEAWFTDNGRDHLGDDLPPDEVNRHVRHGAHYGFPWWHGGDVADPEYRGRRADEFERPAWKLPAHTAPLGLHVYRGDRFPAKYRGALLVAQHGSWNRSTPAGYQVLALLLDPAGRTVTAAEPLVWGFLGRDLAGRDLVRGRPVDIAGLPDGSLLVSDDHAGRVYRLWYEAAR